jgi:hypothetical protein
VLREVTAVAKQKPAPKNKPATKAAKPKKPTAKATAKKAEPPKVADASAELAALGFFRAEYHWEADRDVPALEERVRVLVDHTGGVVAPEQVRAVELLLETETPLRPLAVRAAYETMLRWVEGYRKRHPDFRGKPIGEKAFTRGCELKTVLFPAPAPSEKKPAPQFVLTLFWPDDNRPCEARFEWVKGAWAVTQCERT